MGFMLGMRQICMFLGAFTLAALLVSCADNSASTEGGDNNADTSAAVIEDQVYYQVPTPHEMMDFIRAGGGNFRKELLCSPEIHDRYVDLKGNSMGMGIYIADLAYTASFSEFQESIKYFNVIMKMAEEIGISGVFDADMVDRIKGNLEHPDSLELISDQSYYNIIAELEANDRGKIVAMIAAGGFIESLFIATQLVQKYRQDDPLMHRIASQKFTYLNIMAYLEKYREDQNVEWAINYMTTFKRVFDEVSDTRRDTKFSDAKSGKKVLGGVGGVYITEQEFEELKYNTAFLRNTMTFNPPQIQ